jgi:hypothetical protein
MVDLELAMQWGGTSAHALFAAVHAALAGADDRFDTS